MASRQYNYPPPPPPPPPPSGGYGQYQQPYGAQSRGGGGARGRGGSAGQGRGHFPHASYGQPPHAYSGPPSGGPVGGGYGPPGAAAPYIGPQQPGGSYHPPWQHDQGHQAGHPPAQHQPSPAAVPLSAANYHPNYAPQLYNQPSYASQPGFPPAPPPPAYGAHHPPWNGGAQPPAHSTPQHPSGRSRGRAEVDAPLMGPPIRIGFDNEHVAGHAGNGYPPPYPGPQGSPHGPFPPSPQAYPAQSFPHSAPRHEPQGYHRGKGGPANRGRRDFAGDKNKARFNKPQRFADAHAPSDLPQKPGAAAGEEHDRKRKKKKRKTNTLGLTPSGEDAEESEHEEELGDEETRIVAVLGDDAPQMPTDIEAWIAERKRKFPTRERVVAKQAEKSKRMAERIAERAAKAKSREAEEHAKSHHQESKLERKQRKAEKLRKQLERAEQELQDAQAKAGWKRKRESADEEAETGDAVDRLIAKATSSPDPSDSDSSESSSSSITSSDSKPEVLSSRTAPPAPAPAPAPLPPPTAAAVAGPQKIQRHCKYFSTGGTCGKKGKCRFVHDQATRDAALKEKALNGGKMTLAQRLIQNDREKDDLTIFKSVMALKERGLFESAAASALTDD